jgi:hypothetical protein
MAQQSHFLNAAKYLFSDPCRWIISRKTVRAIMRSTGRPRRRNSGKPRVARRESAQHDAQRRHLAQFNISRVRYPLDDPNGLARRSFFLRSKNNNLNR